MKTYKWAAEPGEVAQMAQSIGTGASRDRRTALTATLLNARAMMAGLPVFLRLGTVEYLYGERKQLTDILDAYEVLARRGMCGTYINALRKFAYAWKKAGKIAISPKFFPFHRDAQQRAAEVLAKIDSQKEGLTDRQAQFGEHAARLDPARRPMSWIAHATAHIRMCRNIESLYAKTRSSPKVAEARMLAYALVHDLVPMLTVTQIAKHFGRDHTTVCNGLRRVREDGYLQETFLVLRDQMRPHFSNPTDILNPR